MADHHNIDPSLGGGGGGGQQTQQHEEIYQVDLELQPDMVHQHDYGAHIHGHHPHQHQHHHVLPPMPQSAGVYSDLQPQASTSHLAVLTRLEDDNGSAHEDGEQLHSAAGRSATSGSSSKRKGKSAPRTSQACLRCRKMKMRCEGSEKAPCRRCAKANADCIFDRRSDLNPPMDRTKRRTSEESEWQSKIEQRVTSMEHMLHQVVLALNGQGTMPPPGSAVQANNAFDSQLLPQGDEMNGDGGGQSQDGAGGGGGDGSNGGTGHASGQEDTSDILSGLVNGQHHHHHSFEVALDDSITGMFGQHGQDKS